MFTFPDFHLLQWIFLGLLSELGSLLGIVCCCVPSACALYRHPDTGKSSLEVPADGEGAQIRGVQCQDMVWSKYSCGLVYCGAGHGYYRRLITGCIIVKLGKRSYNQPGSKSFGGSHWMQHFSPESVAIGYRLSHLVVASEVSDLEPVNKSFTSVGGGGFGRRGLLKREVVGFGWM